MRLHGATIEAIAQGGYEGTTVRHIISLAGVSRRSFYEHFTSKEDCFLATFDVLAGRGVQRMGGAYAATRGELGERLRAAFEEFAAIASTRRKAAALVVVEAQTACAAGEQRLRTATASCERLLSRSFAESPGASALPAPIVRAIAGGLHGAMAGCLRERSAARRSDIAGELLQWTLLFQTPAAEVMCERMAERVAGRLRESSPPRPAGSSSAAQGEEVRRRLLENALRLAVVEDYAQLTAPQIAEEAKVPIEAFFELFADKQECFLAALDTLGEELLALTADPGLTGAEWPQAVRRAIAEVLCFLAEHPLYAQTIARQAFSAGPQAARRSLELAHAVAKRLTDGAPARAPSRLIVEGLAGAMWHTIRCHAEGRRIQLLPALSDYLSYVALAPCIGADAAAELLSEDRDVCGQCGP
jgi:AcrR family transcriptional regulator